ncbi:MAG: uroporphyrinogen-III synthase [Sphingopyxis sp.]|nr:uroporphyrinogen-III synthase [Sphingopyxis sp.]
MRPLIIVRPEPGASATARRAAEFGLNALCVPLFAVEPLDWHAPDVRDFDALLVTSANAVRHAGPQLAALASLPCHCVGAATAAAAGAAGLTVTDIGTAGAQALVDSMTSHGHRKLLWLTGKDRTMLRSDGAQIMPLVCYHAAEIADPLGWSKAVVVPAILLLHSARAAQRASALAGDARKHLIAIAISDAVAAAAGPDWEQLAVAPGPTDADLLAIAAKLCQTPTP